jgi:hypothetical protein
MLTNPNAEATKIKPKVIVATAHDLHPDTRLAQLLILQQKMDAQGVLKGAGWVQRPFWIVMQALGFEPFLCKQHNEHPLWKTWIEKCSGGGNVLAFIDTARQWIALENQKLHIASHLN